MKILPYLCLLLGLYARSVRSQYTIYSYFSASDCSGDADYVTGTESDGCSSFSCTSSDGGNNYFTITCGTAAPSSPGTDQALVLSYAGDSCSGTPDSYGVLEYNTCVYVQDSGFYLQGSCASGIIRVEECTDSACSDCTISIYQNGLCYDDLEITGCPGYSGCVSLYHFLNVFVFVASILLALL